MKRGAITKRKSTPIAIWFPHSLKEQLDQAVQMTDTDRSKLIRNAVREKLEALKQTAAA